MALLMSQKVRTLNLRYGLKKCFSKQIYKMELLLEVPSVNEFDKRQSCFSYLY